MFSWITANFGTILICLALLGMVALAVITLVKDKRAGKSACGGNCAHCHMSCSCHQTK